MKARRKEIFVLFSKSERRNWKSVEMNDIRRGEIGVAMVVGLFCLSIIMVSVCNLICGVTNGGGALNK